MTGGGGYEIPPDVKYLLDQLKAQAEALGLPQEGKAPSDDPSQTGDDKAPKKLPPQLNPLLAKLARAAARENDRHSGAYYAGHSITLPALTTEVKWCKLTESRLVLETLESQLCE